MIGYFIKAGDFRLDPIFSPFQRGFRNILNSYLAGKSYGNDLKLILIEYHLEGQFLQLPDKPISVGRLRKKEHAISVVVGVSKKFQFFSEDEKKLFITNTTMESVRQVKAKFEKLGILSVDFQQLLKDVQESSRIFLEMEISA